MRALGHALAILSLVLSLAGCKKEKPEGTTPAAGGGAADGRGGGAAAAGRPGGPAGEGGGGPMTVAEFCTTFGDKARKEGGKAADYWERHLGKNCVKTLTAERKKKGDESWSAYVSCTTGQSTAADAFDLCEL